MPVKLTPEMEENLTKKCSYHLEHEMENRLNLSVFSDCDQMSTKLWTGMFKVESNYVTDFGLIPVPKSYLPADHNDFVDLVSDFIYDFFERRNLLESNHWGIFNFGTDGDPKFHLVLSNRRLMSEEFGEWLLTDKTGNKYVVTETNKKQRRRQGTRQPRNKPQTTVKAPSEESPADPRRSSSVSGGSVHPDQTRRGTVSSIETGVSSTFSDSGGERRGSTTTGYMAGSSGESTKGAASTESLPQQVLVPTMLLSSIRSQVYCIMGESDDDEENTECGACLSCL